MPSSSTNTANTTSTTGGGGTGTTELISQQELTECDREQLHLIGSIQGDSGNLLFLDFPSGKIVAHDEQIFQVEWIKYRPSATPVSDHILVNETGKPFHPDHHMHQQQHQHHQPQKGRSSPNRHVVLTTDEGTDSDTVGSSSRTEQPADMIGSFIQNWIPFKLYKAILDCVEQMKTSQSQRTFHFYNYKSVHYALSLSTTTRDYSLIGMEIEADHRNNNGNAASANDSFCSMLAHLGHIVEFGAHETIAFTACDMIFQVMGRYNRGMVYKFNDDLSGEVLHEITSSDVETSYLGMRFPASDIPLPSRMLYIQNGVRYIHSIETPSVPILGDEHKFPHDPNDTLNPFSSSLDLTQIRMRAVAKPHIVYLKNMGVKCSLSIAIVVGGELWGLLAFHGYREQFKPALHQRIACETICRMVSVRIESQVKKDQSGRIIQLGRALLTLQNNRNIIDNFYELGDNILSVLDCDIVMILVWRGHDAGTNNDDDDDDDDDTMMTDESVTEHATHNNISNADNNNATLGDSFIIGDKTLKPSARFFNIMFRCPNREMQVLSKREELTARGIAEEDCPACGTVYFHEGATHIFLGRSERSKDVCWAGNPDEPKLRIGGILNPRNSFDTFMEKARMESRSWSTQDMNVISVFRDRICEHVHNWTLTLLQNDIETTNKKYLDAIDRAQDNYEFFARMSHELRTPFHGVMGCLDILEESLGDVGVEEAKELVRTATASGNHMLTLLNSILDIAKNKHLSHSISKTKVIYQSLAFDAIDCMKSLATSRKIQFQCHVTPNEEKIMIATDRTKIVQIVSNIVNNAIKFTGKGLITVNFELVETIQQGISVWQKNAIDYSGVAYTMKVGEMLTSLTTVSSHVSAYPPNKMQRWMCINVADTGCGMKPEELAAMFEPYTQASTGSKRSSEGTGLGLFICVSLCLQLGGFLGCASTPKVGTAFQIGIPVDFIEFSAADLQHKEDAPAPVGDELPMYGPILVVDDNVVNVKILVRSLERELKTFKLEIELITAHSGDDAIELYKTRNPSLCLIDYHMPGKDGIETTSEIRTWEKEQGLRHAHILSYTADATDQSRDLIMKAGANDIMLKPPPKGYIHRLVERIKIHKE